MEIIHTEQLNILGFNASIRLFFIVCIVFLLGFLLLRPIIKNIMMKQYSTLVTYVISSNFALIIALIYTNVSNDSLLLVVILLAIMLLGFLLFIYLSIRSITLFVQQKFMRTKNRYT